MSWLLFLDESGQDRRETPYEVLAGLAIEDRELWNLICRIHDAERDFFGQRISEGLLELKGTKILKRKVFKHAAQMDPIAPDERRLLAKSCLLKGKTKPALSPTRSELTALAQAKLAFVDHLFWLCINHRAKAFASIVSPEAFVPNDAAFLRKDYAFLFERYHSFLETRPNDPQGLIVFDELEKSQSHILIDQMARYFRHTQKGQVRAARIIPEPFFLHSHLTTAIQLADLLAYVINWGFRVGPITAKARPEIMAQFIPKIHQLQFKGQALGPNGSTFTRYGFKYIDDLRPKSVYKTGELLDDEAEDEILS